MDVKALSYTPCEIEYLYKCICIEYRNSSRVWKVPLEPLVPLLMCIWLNVSRGMVYERCARLKYPVHPVPCIV